MIQEFKKIFLIITVIFLANNIHSQEYKSILLDYDFNPSVENLIIYNDSIYFVSIGFFSSSGGTVITSLDIELNNPKNYFFDGFFAANRAFSFSEHKLNIYVNSRTRTKEDMLLVLNKNKNLDTIGIYTTDYDNNLAVQSTNIDHHSYLSWFDIHPDGDRSFGIRKVDSLGNIIWKNNFHIDSSYSKIWDLDISYDDHLLISNDIVLNTPENGSEFYGQVKKLGQDGNLIWEYTTDYFLWNSAGQPSTELSNREIIISHQHWGRQELFGSDVNPRPQQITWISEDGHYLRDFYFGTGLTERLDVLDLKRGNGGYFFAVGNINKSTMSGSKGFIVKFDNNGEIIWKREYTHPGQEETGHQHSIENLVELDNGDLITLGTTGLLGATAKPWLMKLNSEGCLSGSNCGRPLTLATQDAVVEAPVDLFFPNPSEGIFMINEIYSTDIKEIKIFNLQGALIYEYQDAIPAQLDLRNYAAGIYTIQLRNKEGAISIAKVLKH